MSDQTSPQRRGTARSHVAALVLGLLASSCYGVVGNEGLASPDEGGAPTGSGGSTGAAGGRGGASTGTGGSGGSTTTGTGGATGKGGTGGIAGTGGSTGTGGTTGTGGAAGTTGTGGTASTGGTAGAGTGGSAGTSGAGGAGAGGAVDAGTGKGGSAGTSGASGAAGAAGMAPCTNAPTANGATMRPGAACKMCHGVSGPPAHTVMGTVFPANGLHQAEGCIGLSGVQVVLTPANGNAVTLTTNSSGNFYSTTTIATPFSAKVVSNGVEKPMMAMVTDGNCNSCHTQNGTMSAAGRITP